MISPKTTLELFKKNSINLYTGVPDSLLKNFCAYLDDALPTNEHIIAANEGGAIALATGHYLATGNPALVYMQNSGLGNAINPLLSLTDPEVYAIPIILMIGWRGEPNIPDEPQHIKQGRITPALLQAMEIPYEILDNESNIDEVITKVVRTTHERSAPVGIVVKKGAFAEELADNSMSTQDLGDLSLTREEAIEIIAKELGESATIVSTTGKISRELYEYRLKNKQDHAQDFLTVGSMGHSSQIALGIALAKPNQDIYCLDGDGAILMHTGALAIAGQTAPSNFKHIVLNNGVHDSVGGQPSAGFLVDFVKIAQATGYAYSTSATTQEALKTALLQIKQSTKPAFLEVRVLPGARENLGRPKTTPAENKQAFTSRLRKLL